MSVALFNRVWARVILTALIRQGVQHICIAPGSRSTPLTLEAARFAREQRVRVHTHFDERGLGFYALGLAKSSEQCVVIITTSGTAVANLYPAVIEASLTGVKLVVLSADRPVELLHCGANQSIEQQGIFADYPVAALNLPRPSEELKPQWLLSVLSEALFKQQQGGVVHINAPFAEPLYGVDESAVNAHPWLEPIQPWLKSSQHWRIYPHGQREVLVHENWDEWRTKRGVIVVGKLGARERMGLAQWAQTLGWVMITDIQSGIAAPLPHADIWLANEAVRTKLLNADIVIQFGRQIISKRVQQFLATFSGEFWQVDTMASACDPHHHHATRFVAPVHHWLRAHPPLRQREWLLEPLALSKFCREFIAQQVGGKLNEASLAHFVERILPRNGVLFLGNSLFVRLVDALGFLPEDYPVFTNRGASGIDGLIATAAGVGQATGQPLVAMIGDVSALYDLNSLALLRQVPQPTIVFVINNNGGAIFNMLGVEQDVKDTFYRMPHGLEFAQAAAMFGLNYQRPYTWADLNTVLKQAYARKETTLIEIKSAPSEGSDIYRNLLDQIAKAVIGG
ncbi:2-succinyl-5-enolpyruvyl-6-hydroxy-3-cyclohexene-1-carboxylic-acid synthase [Pasteurellaceae bacterium HPA106]|uniref:2-succinyl-5-enolpyruvyl-6-hydroxy-3- cyclohexene-1-carboxylic-acid synthase n=1 Tax=Spirabiliibacterium pneumoniae TaxID=221400 RepID=UPI001AACF879|nr:2-succinyl-5-enolpyruvyl-6-hydroxy-3-cyclohexene-1-carboxylic-acid synthase [Spirabiliibacterium pneumoniae]MBE2896457.1 2-succinyl-5-enolpyruvyl-6-hydroxy-3-cyclohexene-1-carboxylic-acid synthase [Spirabiliibacterium pneumoniae]